MADCIEQRLAEKMSLDDLSSRFFIDEFFGRSSKEVKIHEESIDYRGNRPGWKLSVLAVTGKRI